MEGHKAENIYAVLHIDLLSLSLFPYPYELINWMNEFHHNNINRYLNFELKALNLHSPKKSNRKYFVVPRE